MPTDLVLIINKVGIFSLVIPRIIYRAPRRKITLTGISNCLVVLGVLAIPYLVIYGFDCTEKYNFFFTRVKIVN